MRRQQDGSGIKTGEERRLTGLDRGQPASPGATPELPGKVQAGAGQNEMQSAVMARIAKVRWPTCMPSNCPLPAMMEGLMRGKNTDPVIRLSGKLPKTEKLPPSACR